MSAKEPDHIDQGYEEEELAATERTFRALDDHEADIEQSTVEEIKTAPPAEYRGY